MGRGNLRFPGATSRYKLSSAQFLGAVCWCLSDLNGIYRPASIVIQWTLTQTFEVTFRIIFFAESVQLGESFEQCAAREAKEETNLDLENLKFFHVTNNPNMDNDPEKHYITIFMKVTAIKFAYAATPHISGVDPILPKISIHLLQAVDVTMTYFLL